MVRLGIPIKVKIGLRPNGHADHPNWLLLPLASGGGNREAKEALVSDEQIVKWAYDKSSGHDEETVDSPIGVQFGMMVVTQKFADEAVIEFPSLITVLTEGQARIFWETKATAHMPENKLDSDVLQGLKAQRDLMVDLGQNTATLDIVILKALDPDDTEPGVRKGGRKSWNDAKNKLGFGIKP